MNAEEFKAKCKGVVPVQFCPYTEDRESVDLEALESNTRFLVEFSEGGSRDVVVFTNGSTTEFYANSVEEQKSVIKTVVETVGGVIPVIAGVSQAGTRETVKMARYAEEVGCDGVIAVTPYYHIPFEEGVYQHYRSIADAVRIGVIVYNNPSVSAADIGPELTRRLSKIENVVALKDNTATATDWFNKSRLVDPEDMALLIGPGEINYVAAAAFGFAYKGFVSNIANYAPEFSYAVYEAVAKEGDFLKVHEVLLEKIAPIVTLTNRLARRRRKISILPQGYRGAYLYQAVGKTAMDMVEGLYGGPCRLPMEDLTEDEREKVGEVLEQVGLI